jgi:hypothetical protein
MRRRRCSATPDMRSHGDRECLFARVCAQAGRDGDGDRISHGHHSCCRCLSFTGVPANDSRRRSLRHRVGAGGVRQCHRSRRRRCRHRFAVRASPGRAVGGAERRSGDDGRSPPTHMGSTTDAGNAESALAVLKKISSAILYLWLQERGISPRAYRRGIDGARRAL